MHSGWGGLDGGCWCVLGLDPLVGANASIAPGSGHGRRDSPLVGQWVETLHRVEQRGAIVPNRQTYSHTNQSLAVFDPIAVFHFPFLPEHQDYFIPFPIIFVSEQASNNIYTRLEAANEIASFSRVNCVFWVNRLNRYFE